MRYVALLRAINASEQSRVRMAALRTCLEDAGMNVVATYLQSGNVILEEELSRAGHLAGRIERALKEGLGIDTVTVVLSERELAAVVYAAPADWQQAIPRNQRDSALRQIVFLLPPLTPIRILRDFQHNPEVEFLGPGPMVLYWAISPDRMQQSALSGLARTPAYRHLTVRTYATVSRLLELTSAAGEAG